MRCSVVIEESTVADQRASPVTSGSAGLKTAILANNLSTSDDNVLGKLSDC